MKIRNKISVLFIVVITVIFPSIKILAQEFDKETPDGCFSGLGFSMSKYLYSKTNPAEGYVYAFKWINHYPKMVSFDCNFKVGDHIIPRTIERVAKNGGKWSEGMILIKGPEDQAISILIDHVCFEGMKCGGENNCYADCSSKTDPLKPVIPCGLNSEQEENTKPAEKKVENTKGPFVPTVPQSGIYVHPGVWDIRLEIVENGLWYSSWNGATWRQKDFFKKNGDTYQNDEYKDFPGIGMRTIKFLPNNKISESQWKMPDQVYTLKE